MDKLMLDCIVVDDEPMAANLVVNYIEKTPFLNLRGKFHNAIEALNFVSENPVQLLFLDIQMPDLTGLELSKMLPKNAKIIFTTAFDQYALEGFKVEALDYLLKPFDYAEFLTAANKAKKWFTMLESSSGLNTSTESDFLFIKSEYKHLRIKLSDVLYFEGLKDYIKIWLKNESKPILTLKSLKSLEEELPKNQFMRVHRSYIVALKSIEEVERSQIIINGKRITVSEQYKPDFLNFINDNSLS
ncbi:LytR/AlgR family response regulator transcription factor [Joostella sp. CR20]|uniref:LytR/AlgR family response regulator transcription factor n=1 Tax=Joostella sp. CR20 TaxID=2804312 RepID=UPI00313EFF16